MFIHVVNNLRILTITTNVQNDVTCSSQDILLLLFMLNVFSSIIVIPTWNVVCAPCMLEPLPSSHFQKNLFPIVSVLG